MTEFAVTSLSAAPFAYVERTAPVAEIPKAMGEGFAALAAMFAKARARMAGPPLAHYLTFDGRSTRFELGFPVRAEDEPALKAAGASIGETPKGEVMQALHVGPYDEVPKVYDALLAEMKARGLEGATDMWERYLSPPETPAEDIRTEVIWPLKKAG